eukprot:jgi/Orpsp1_1/1180850/evm.model.c7180000074861.1
MSNNTFSLNFPDSQNDFRSLKKQLRDVVKIGNDNHDVQGWSTDLRLWIQLQNIANAKTIYYGCLLTSQGDAQRFISDLKESEKDDDI